MEMWWDDWHSCSAAMDHYKLFSGERQGRTGGEATLYVGEYFVLLELGDGADRVGHLWVRIRGKASKANVVAEGSGSVADHPARRRQTKFNVSCWKKSHNCQLLFS